MGYWFSLILWKIRGCPNFLSIITLLPMVGGFKCPAGRIIFLLVVGPSLTTKL